MDEMEKQEIFSTHLAGLLSTKDVYQKGLNRTQLWRYKKKALVSDVTHIWLRMKGYIRKNDQVFWSIHHARYLAGTSLKYLEEELGISAQQILNVFNSNSLPKKTAVQEANTARQTCQLKYGADHPLQTRGCLEKQRKTNQERYGVPNVSLVKSIMDRKNKVRSATILERKRLRLLPLLEKQGLVILENYAGLHVADSNKVFRYKLRHGVCQKEFESSLVQIPICPFCFPKEEYRSRQELNYASFVSVLGFDVTHPKRFLEMGHRSWAEIDVYVPSKKVGFEINGLFYHAIFEGRFDGRIIHRLYHSRKTAAALEKGIKLYHIWQHADQDIVKSMISNVLGKARFKMNARDLLIQEPTVDEEREVLSQSHLMGYTKSCYALSLKDKLSGKVYSMITFRKLEEGGLEIARFVTIKDTIVRGAFSRLFKHALEVIRIRFPDIIKIITYADRDWSPDHRDTVYFKQGFEYLGDSGPSMYYTNFNEVFQRHQFQKHKLQAAFPETFNSLLTEQDNLSLQGIYPFYTSGNHKFVYYL